MNLQEATIKMLLENSDNPVIYKIILKDGTELDKEYIDIKEASEEAEKLSAKNVKQRYKDNSLDGLFQVFLKDNYFTKYDYLKYENGILYLRDNFGWHKVNNQNDYYKFSINMKPFIIGKETDPWEAPSYIGSILIIDTRDGSVYRYEDYSGDYQPLKEYKEELQKVLDGTYGERLHPPYWFDPLECI